MAPNPGVPAATANSAVAGRRWAPALLSHVVCQTFGESLPRNAASMPPSTNTTEPTMDGRLEAGAMDGWVDVRV
ncbi:hypothetical protein BTZ20_0788 [Rhodococcus sp. MTM3W5.2]|nr:hypothetical protein BTZ20_0788 [Rhodococcus sp. MTM3W5.2]